MLTSLGEIRAFLPLVITAAHVDESGMSVSGTGWRLRVNTHWRATREGVLVLSPSMIENAPVANPLERLLGDTVVTVDQQSSAVGLDLLMATDSGLVLEIFSDFPYGEWIFSVWSPDDELRIPVYDLEGPSGG